MKIQDVNRAPQTTETAATTKQSGGPAAAKASGATPAVGSVNISAASLSLQSVGSVNGDAPFDAKRVDAIKSAIASGQFKVNPEAVADKVIDSASQLLVGQTS